MYALYLIFIIANIIMIPLGIIMIRLAATVLRAPRGGVMPVIMLLCAVGAFATGSNLFSVVLVGVFGMLGFVMERNGYPVAALVLGIVMGTMVEQNFVTSLIKSDGDILPFFERPVSGVLAALTFGALLWPAGVWVCNRMRGRRLASGSAAGQRGRHHLPGRIPPAGVAAARPSALAIDATRRPAGWGAQGGDQPMNELSRRTLLGSGAALLAAPLAAPAFAQPKWPARPVQLLCPWAAGGGTDAVVRIAATLLESDLGQPFNVVNRTGGSGVVGHTAIAQATPDGYTLGIITSEICMLHWQGLTEVTYKNFTPLGQMNNDPPGIQVNVNSPYKTAKELAEAIKASPPGKFKASGTGQGGIWHLALAGWLIALGLKADHVRWVPSNGAAPAMQDLAAGGLDFTTCSVPEARAMLDAGRARSLAVMAPARLSAFPNIPTLKEAMGMDFTAGAMRSIAGPAGLPAEVKAVMEPALRRSSTARNTRTS